MMTQYVNKDQFLAAWNSPSILKFKMLCELSRVAWNNRKEQIPEHDRARFEAKFHQFSNLIPDTRCFVFRRAVFGSGGWDAAMDDDWGRIDIPFRTCSFELIERNATFFNMPSVNGLTSYPACIWVHEEDPENYLIAALGWSEAGPTFEIWHEGPLSKGRDSLMPYVREICRHVALGKLGQQKASHHRVRVGFGQNKRTVRVSQIVHVVPKTESGEAVGIGGAKINWSHRWEVRGHWRKIDGIGKDRDNQYQVAGWTWVTPHIKGEGVLVKKTRLVSGDNAAPEVRA